MKKATKKNNFNYLPYHNVSSNSPFYNSTNKIIKSSVQSSKVTNYQNPVPNKQNWTISRIN